MTLKSAKDFYYIPLSDVEEVQTLNSEVPSLPPPLIPPPPLSETVTTMSCYEGYHPLDEPLFPPLLPTSPTTPSTTPPASNQSLMQAHLLQSHSGQSHFGHTMQPHSGQPQSMWEPPPRYEHLVEAGRTHPSLVTVTAKESIPIYCPYCRSVQPSSIRRQAGLKASLGSFFTCLICWPLCWLPLTMRACLDVVHRCSVCNHAVAIVEA